MVKFLTIVLLILIILTNFAICSKHQIGTAGSAVSNSASNKLQSIIGQTVIGSSGDLKSGFLYRNTLPIYLPGDADGNGLLDISDAVFILSYIFDGGEAPDPLANADADCTGQIDITDVVYLISFIFNGGDAPVYCP